jgi:hypothetical protein
MEVAMGIIVYINILDEKNERATKIETCLIAGDHEYDQRLFVGDKAVEDFAVWLNSHDVDSYSTYGAGVIKQKAESARRLLDQVKAIQGNQSKGTVK